MNHSDGYKTTEEQRHRPKTAKKLPPEQRRLIWETTTGLVLAYLSKNGETSLEALLRVLTKHCGENSIDRVVASLVKRRMVLLGFTGTSEERSILDLYLTNAKVSIVFPEKTFLSIPR